MLANSGEYISKMSNSLKNDEDQPCHHDKLRKYRISIASTCAKSDNTRLPKQGPITQLVRVADS